MHRTQFGRRGKWAIVDELDSAITRHLQADARLTNRELARTLGIAPSTCLERVRALRRRGILRGFHADVDPAAIGYGLQAMIAVRLSAHTREQITAFTDHVRVLDGVLSIFHMTGETDYLLHVAARDAHDLREFVVEHLASDPAVAHAQTSLIYEQRSGPGVPLG